MTDGGSRIAIHELLADADIRLKARLAQFLLVCPLDLRNIRLLSMFFKSSLKLWLSFYYSYKINPVKNCQFYDVYSSPLEIYLASSLFSHFYNTQ